MLVIKEYECENCGRFEELQKHSSMFKKCPKCKSKNIERLISKPLVAKDNEPKTVGSMIERNNKRNPLTREKVFGVDAEKKLAEESKMKKLANMTPEQTKRYVEDGVI